MLVCSFNMKKRFSRGEENTYSLNHSYQTDNEENPIAFDASEQDKYSMWHLRIII